MPSLLFIAMALLTEPTPHRKLVFEQDFSRLTDVDESVWSFYQGPVYNNEQQTYTGKEAKNVWIENGALVIEGRKDNGVITSGKLESKQAWKYGKFEFVAKVPGGRGTWPAIWMLNEKIRSGKERLGWPLCGEIDIMENVGFDPHKFHFTVHSGKYNHTKNTQRGSSKVIAEDGEG
ncbi:MAG: glycoside hydrolase family 16 protein, partial [bacterium]